MRGEKTIKFDFEFPCSRAGVLVEADTITIRMPGLNNFTVYNSIMSTVSKAVMGFLRSLPEQAMKQADAPADEGAAEAHAGDDERDSMQILAVGLESEAFATFVAYLKKVLTNSPFATVGEAREPLTDEVWIGLEQNGGMEAVNRVLSDFVGFFLDAMGSKSRKKSGPAPSPTSASPTKAPSPSVTPRASRTRN